MPLMDAQIAKWEKVGFTSLISKRELTEVYDPQIVLEDRLDQLVMTLKGYVLTADVGEPQTIVEKRTVETKVVASLWDHFKLQYGSKWWMPFKKVNWNVIRKPVVLMVTVEPRAMFPHAKIQFPHTFGKPVIYYKVSYD